MRRHVFLFASAVAIAGGFAQADDIRVKLGSQARVAGLFSFPDNCVVAQPPSCDWTLAQTVEHYLTQSVQRDGYTNATVKVRQKAKQVSASISGVPADYGSRITGFLKTGELAIRGALKLKADKKWQDGWYFFLPVGMTLENRRSVELLHFPPDYSLTEAHDYLESKTTDRWASLLVLNGVAADSTPAYQTIIDIAPIAAPASAGSSLSDTYSYFTRYQTTLVAQWTRYIGQGAASYPMVAFGGPVRDWIKTQYGVSLAVLGLGQIKPTPERSVSVLGSNHPSYIWYAADPKNHGGNQQAADQAGIAVVGQDVTAACWQAGMGMSPAGDPSSMLSGCESKWPAGSPQVCELFYTSIRNLPPEQAKAQCTQSS